MDWLLSGKQRALIAQLERLVSIVQKEQLPVEVLAIHGFGSFFRGKKDPRDVDVKIEYGDNNRFYDLFRKAVETIADLARRDATVESRTPQEVFNSTVEQLIQQNPDDSVTWKEFRNVCSNWLQGITWNMIFSDEYSYAIDRHRLTDRLLKRNSRNVNISHGIGKLLTDTIFVVWSREKNDFRKNMQEIFSPATIKQSRIQSLREFELQLVGARLHVDYLRTLFKAKTEGGEYRKIKDEEMEKRFPVIARVKKRRLGERWTVTSESDLKELDLKLDFDPSKYENRSDDELEKIVEEKRVELKKTYEIVEVLETVSGYYLDLLVERVTKGELASNKIPIYLALFTLEKVPKKLVKEERIRECLRMLGLPEHEIETNKGSRGDRTYYNFRREPNN